MIIFNHALPRRTFLRGLGATLALPLLDSMVPTIAGARPSKAPDAPGLRLHAERHHRRVRQEPAAVHVDAEDRRRELRVQPDDEGARAVPRADQRVQRPGAGHRPGARRRPGRPRARDRDVPHRRASATRPAAPTSSLGISADQIAAKELGKYTQLASLELGLEPQPLAGNCDSGYTCAYMSMSWRGPTSPLPAEINPRAVFERLFGDGDSTDAAGAHGQARTARRACSTTSPAACRGCSGGWAPATSASSTSISKRSATSSAAFSCAEEQNATMELPHMERPSAIPDDYEQYTQADDRHAGRRLADRHDARRVVHARPRRQQPRVSRDRHLRRPPLDLASSGRSARSVDKLIKIDELHVVDVRLPAEEAEGDARRRRHAARSLAGAVRQQHQRVEHPHARRSADRARRHAPTGS